MDSKLYDEILDDLKSTLLSKENVGIKRDDLLNTSININNYSSNLALYLADDGLIYLWDKFDDTHGLLDFDDFVAILSSVAQRRETSVLLANKIQNFLQQ